LHLWQAWLPEFRGFLIWPRLAGLITSLNPTISVSLETYNI
jgi:hypothetical protein